MEASPLEKAVREWYEAKLQKIRAIEPDFDLTQATETLQYRVAQTLATLRESLDESAVPTAEQIHRAELESDLRRLREFASDEEHGPMPEAMKLGFDFAKEMIESQLDPSKPMPDSLAFHARLRELDADAGEPPTPQAEDGGGSPTPQ